MARLAARDASAKSLHLQVMEPFWPGITAAIAYRGNVGVERDQHIRLRMLPESGDLAVLLTRDMGVVAERSQCGDQR